MHLLTVTFEPQNHITSSTCIHGGHSIHQTHWDHSFLSYAADKQTDKQTDRLSLIYYPRRPILSAWVISYTMHYILQCCIPLKKRVKSVVSHTNPWGRSISVALAVSHHKITTGDHHGYFCTAITTTTASAAAVVTKGSAILSMSVGSGADPGL